MRYISLFVLLTAAPVFAAGNGRQTLPLFFIANYGQAPSSVRYMAQGPELTAYFSATKVLFRLGDRAIQVQLEGASRSTVVEGIETLPGQVNFLTGPQASWRTGQSIYGGVAYRNLYPGIDMVYNGNARNLKSEFRVAPGADPSRIRVRYSGAGELRIDRDGALVFPLGSREFREDAPVIYQVRDGGRQHVDGRFRLSADGTVGFVLGDYDRSLPLIIDPVVYSTLLGGSSSDAANALAVDAAGSAYLAGFTASLDFPAVNPAQSASGGSNDIFVAKLNPAGNGLVYCTYLGGKGDDRAYAIAVDAAGAAYITGSTTSTAFPTRNPLQASLLGSKDAFVVKLNPAGNATVFSTYLGGAGSDVGNGIAVDGDGNVYVTGDSASVNFPTTTYQRSLRGGQDAFVTKLAAAGSPILYSTYLGGSYDDHSSGIAVDAGGSAYIAGSTFSADFPVAAAQQSQNGGGQDAFVARFDPTGSSLLFSTFLGGSGGSVSYPEAAIAIALDAQGNAYVTGTTSSTNFPLLNAVQSVRRGSLDAFVSKYGSGGALINSTYLGGAGLETGNAIAVDANGNAYIAGQTLSTDLPVYGSFQQTSGGQYDAFVAKLAASGAALDFLSYLGGNGSDTATGIALDSSGNIYIAGWTQSVNFPVLNGFQSINAGTYGAFLTKVTVGAPPAAVSVTPNTGSGAIQTFSFLFSNSTGATGLNTVSVLFQAGTSTASACSVTYNRAANTLALLTDAGAVSGATITPGSGSVQNTQCMLTGSGSSVSISGNDLTLSLNLTFQAAFSGSKNIYMQATSSFGSTGWQSRGTWTVAAGPPQAVSVTPSSGSGSTQTFSFLFTDPRGYAAINTASIIVATSLSGTNSCYMYYARAANAIYLANDAGTAWLASAVLGSATMIQNTQCSIAAASSSVTSSGNNMTLTLSLTFKSAYLGAKNIYMEVHDGLDSGWQNRGTWTVTDNGPPSPVSVTPASGSGASQTFTFEFTDPRGYTAITTTSMIIGTSAAGTNSCYLYYARASNSIYLANDAGSAWLTPAVLGTAATIQNTQCSIAVAGATASGSGNNLTLTLPLTFKSPYTGAKTTYLQVYDGNSGWVVKGAWTVTLANVFGPVSVTPSSGSGSTQTFSFLFNDPSGYATISSASIIIGASLAGGANCYLYYARASNAIYLANDAGNAWLTPAVLGASATIQNSQCSIAVASSSSSGSGTQLTVNLNLTFKPAYAGAKTIYMEVYNGSDSGWVSKGAWIAQ